MKSRSNNFALFAVRFLVLMTACVLVIHGVRSFSHPIVSPLAVFPKVGATFHLKPISSRMGETSKLTAWRFNSSILRGVFFSMHKNDPCESRQCEATVSSPSLVSSDADDSCDASCEDILEEGAAHVLSIDFLWNSTPPADCLFQPSPRITPVPILLQTSVLRI